MMIAVEVSIVLNLLNCLFTLLTSNSLCMNTETWFGIDAGYSKPGFAVAKVAKNLEGKWVPDQFIHAEAFESERRKGKASIEFKKLPQTKQDCYIIQDTVIRLCELIHYYNPNKVIVELPTGGAKSSSAVRAMGMATAMTMSTLTSINFGFNFFSPLSIGKQAFDVVAITPIQNKKGSTGAKVWKGSDHDQDKWAVLNAVKAVWPEVPFPHKKTKKKAHELEESVSWAMSDALSCILTHVRNLNEA